MVPTALGRFGLIASKLGLRKVRWPSEGRGEDLLAGELRAGLGAPEFLKRTGRKLADYFGGRKVRFSVPLDLSGLSGFAGRVLRALAEVPHGQTTTYGELAVRIGSPKAARAVGNILARNPLPIIIPCHRVVTAGGGLGGFSGPGGTSLKRHLLLLENIEL